MRPNTRISEIIAHFICLIISSFAIVSAQPRPPLHRLEYRDLGYPFFSQIPADGSYVTSLAPAPDGRVYGATTGFQSYLFVYSPKTNQVKPLGHLPNCEGVHHSLVIGKEGRLFLGGGKNVIQSIPIIKRSGGGRDWVSEDLWQQVLEQYRGYAGGRLYSYDPPEDEEAWRGDRPAKVKDLGSPVPGDGIYCLAIDYEREVLYGVSYPRGHFFLHDVTSGNSEDLGPISRRVVFGGPDIRTLRSLPRNLAVDTNGYVYASADDGRVVRYDPWARQIQALNVFIPGESMQIVEAWAVSGEVLYGGTSEGFIFRFRPDSQSMENLGKPLVSPRIRGLTLGKDGRLYGVGGDRHGVNQLFAYDPATGSFLVFGGVDVDRSPYYARRAHQFDAMVTSVDGTVFLGESDRGGHLFLFLP